MTIDPSIQSQKSATELARLDERTRKTEADLANMEKLHREEMRALTVKIDKQHLELTTELKMINKQLNRGYGGFAVIVAAAGVLGGLVTTAVPRMFS